MKLYLHGGPGLSASIERQWFGETLPVHWWDQPMVAAEDAQPYQRLLDAARAELGTLADATGKPVDVVTHSFGGLIGLDLLRLAGEQIGTLTLLAPTPDAYRQLCVLGERLAESPDARPALKAAHARAGRSRSRANLRQLAEALLAENPFRHYWGPHAGALRSRHETLAARHLVFDLDTYVAVSWDRAAQPPCPIRGRLPPHARIRCLFGAWDPLLGAPEREQWRRWLPDAEHRLVDAGHFLQFELPPEHWL